MKSLQSLVRVVLFLGAAAMMTAQVAAQTGAFPVRPLKLVVPFPAGGSSDILGRVFADRLGAELGQPVIVDNRTGAGGNVGTVAAARAKPDGYTLMITADSSMVINPSLYKSTGFDPIKDFEPVGTVATAGYVLVANPAFAPKNTAELIALAKQQPGKINIGSAGNGTLNHLIGEELPAHEAGAHLSNSDPITGQAGSARGRGCPFLGAAQRPGQRQANRCSLALRKQRAGAVAGAVVPVVSGEGKQVDVRPQALDAVDAQAQQADS